MDYCSGSRNIGTVTLLAERILTLWPLQAIQVAPTWHRPDHPTTAAPRCSSQFCLRSFAIGWTLLADGVGTQKIYPPPAVLSTTLYTLPRHIYPISRPSTVYLAFYQL